MDIVNVVVAAVAIVAAAIAYLQVRRMQEIAHGELLDRTLLRLNSLEQRKLRARLYAASRTPFTDWTTADFDTAEAIAATFSQIGFLMKRGYLTVDALDYWGKTFVVSYEICGPLIRQRRETEGSDVLYIHFEWLARTAMDHERSRRWWNSGSWARLRSKTSELDELLGSVSLPRSRPHDDIPRGENPGELGTVSPQ